MTSTRGRTKFPNEKGPDKSFHSSGSQREVEEAKADVAPRGTLGTVWDILDHHDGSGELQEAKRKTIEMLLSILNS